MKKIKLKIGHRLGVGFGLVIAITIAVAGIGALYLSRSNDSMDEVVNQRFPHGVLINTLKSDFAEIISKMQKIIIENHPQGAHIEISLIEQAVEFITENMAKLEQSGVLLPEERQNITELKSAYAAFLPAKTRFVEIAKTGEIGDLSYFLSTNIYPLSVAYLLRLDALIGQNEELARRQGEAASAIARRALALMLALAGIGCVVAAAIGIVVTRAITRPLKVAVKVAELVAHGDLTMQIEVSSSDETGMLMQSLRDMNDSLIGIVGKVRDGTSSIELASAEIAAGTASLSDRTVQQARALGQTAASITELAATVKQTADNAGLASEQAKAASDTAVQGGGVVTQVVQTMELIKRSSQRIVDIIGVVDGIAFQTNILALNAAVEAARAGSEGRGFAVVAAEVRSLAQRSAEASKEIKILIEDSVQNVDAGSALVASAGKTMDEIVASVQRAAHLMNEISEASREQSSGIDSVHAAIQQMDQMTQQNAEMVEQATSASVALKEQSADLARSVSIFKTPLETAHPGAREEDPPPEPVAAPAVWELVSLA